MPRETVASRYAEAFRQVANALEASQGFWLQPLETDSEDVARALADWLAAHGWSVTTLGPAAGELATLPRRLAKRPAGKKPVVLVVGTGAAGFPNTARAIRALNLRRELLARELGCPLLWLGPPTFLALTATEAPDLWSVRAMRIKLVATGAEGLPLGPMTLAVDGATEEQSEEELRLALARAEGQADHAAAASFGARLAGLLVDEERHAEAETTARRAVSAARASGALAEAGRAGLELGRALTLQLRFADAEQAFDEALVALRSAGDSPAQAHALMLLGSLHTMTGRLDEAEGAIRGALDSFGAQGDEQSQAVALNMLGLWYANMGRLAEAETAHLRAVATFRALGAAKPEAATLMALGQLYLRMHRFTDAVNAQDRAVAIYRRLGDHRGEADALAQLGAVHAAVHDLDAAEAAYGRAQEVYRNVGFPVGEVHCSHALAALDLDRGRPRSAHERCLAARARAREVPGLVLPGPLGIMARAAAALGHWERAVILAGASWKEARNLGDRAEEVESLWQLARTAGKHEETVGALALSLAWNLAEGSKHVLGRARQAAPALVDVKLLPENMRAGDVTRLADELAARLDELTRLVMERGDDPFGPLPDPPDSS